MEVLYLFVVAAGSLFYSATALECYACTDQDSNKEKCIKTTKQCEQHENICSAKIRWAIPPYWTPHGERIHYISKDCDVKDKCQNRQKVRASLCKRDWYNDWECTECCAGDLCNYYVTLGTSHTKASILCALPAIIIGLFSYVYAHLVSPL